MDINKIRTFAKENKKVLLIGIGFIAYLFLLSYLGYDGLIAISVIGAFAIGYAYLWIKSKKMEKEKCERERIEKEEKVAAINAFFASIDLEAEIDYIFSVIGTSPTWSVFEKGLANLIKKTTDNAPSLSGKVYPKDLFPAVREFLLKRIVNSGEIAPDDPAVALLADDLSDRLRSYLLDNSAARGAKALATDVFGLSFRAANHILCRENGSEYAPASDTVLLDIIDRDSTLRECYESNPFTADEVKQGLIKGLRNAAYRVMNSCYDLELSEDEKTLDTLCCIGCFGFTHWDTKDSIFATSAVAIATAILHDLAESK